MAIVNRTLDVSEQRKVFQQKLVAAECVNGFSGIICIAPYPATLDAGSIALFGISGAPQFQLSINRTGGAGATFVCAVGTSNIPLAHGSSGAFQMILPASGSTLLNVGAGDVIMYAQTGGTGAAAGQVVMSLVLKPIQDIKTQHGV